MPDLVSLRGLRVLGTHGALAEERTRAQPFEIDLDVVADLGPAGASDDLGDTVDYGDIAATVAAVVSGDHAELLEHLATDIADAVLARSDRATGVTVTVRKLRPPVPLDLDSASVTITRTR